MPCRQLTLGGELIAHTQLTQAQAPLKGLQNDAVAAVLQYWFMSVEPRRLNRLGRCRIGWGGTGPKVILRSLRHEIS